MTANVTAKKGYDSKRQRERQARILECAREMLDEAGYSKFSMRKLAERAAVSRTTLYNLYGSRDILAIAAVEKSIREIRQRVDELDPEDGVERMVISARIGREQQLAYPNYTRAMARVLLNAEPDDELVPVLFGPHRPAATAQIEIAQRKGQISPKVNATLLAQHLNGQTWGVTLNWLMGRFSDEQLVTEGLRSILSGLIAVAIGPTKRMLKRKLDRLDGADADADPTSHEQKHRRSGGKVS